MSKPITPKEALSLKQAKIPDEVFDAFNELIAENISGDRVNFSQKDVVSRIKSKLRLKRNDPIFDNGWLDIEEIYEKAGWEVDYDKPGFNESHEPTFTFTSK